MVMDEKAKTRKLDYDVSGYGVLSFVALSGMTVAGCPYVMSNPSDPGPRWLGWTAGIFGSILLLNVVSYIVRYNHSDVSFSKVLENASLTTSFIGYIANEVK